MSASPVRILLRTLSVLLVVASSVSAQQVDPASYAGLRFRTIGPEGNRSDFRPTDQQGEVHVILLERLEEAQRLMDALLADDLPVLNAKLAERRFPVISDLQQQ